MFRKILIANRGEIAVRVLRACRELGIATVVAHSEADRNSLAVALADQAICIGPAASDGSYLNIPNIVSAALVTGADAIHPGYGFLAENAYLAEICAQYGLTFIGPPPEVLERFGDKVGARKLMQQAGVPIIPGSDEACCSLDDARQAAEAIGYPVMLKAVAGGGGRGMRVARDAAELARVFPIAQLEAQAHFANGGLYLERLLAHARHVEVQIVADRYGHMIHLGERDCTAQRRHQKLVEEAPSPALTPELRQQMGALAVRGAQAAGYQTVGTMEFLLDEQRRYYFIEANCRIQVEHPVTEMVTGLDLVKEQIRLASGQPLRWRQEEVAWRGHAIECRVTAEDPAADFTPDAGLVEAFHAPGGPGIRVDSHLFSGYTTPPYYDSLLAKIIAWGTGREEAIARLQGALRECRVYGVKTNLAFQLALLDHEAFRRGDLDVRFVEEHLTALQGERPLAREAALSR
ncbi:MAG: acetyl-CoA carboxylase biotin carboxylase subunit [Chloroflexi bacterium]|nr:acetyl-CoA carboxylase biotin carboxylase subunit [Chloroflexota bacterium]